MERLDGRQMTAETGRVDWTIDQLVFVGLNGNVAALDRLSGEVVWSNKLKNGLNAAYVTLLLESDRLIVSISGYIYCLDPLTGGIIWHNPLKGYGIGPTSLLSSRGQSSQVMAQQAAFDTAIKTNSAAAVVIAGS